MRHITNATLQNGLAAHITPLDLETLETLAKKMGTRSTKSFFDALIYEAHYNGDTWLVTVYVQNETISLLYELPEFASPVRWLKTSLMERLEDVLEKASAVIYQNRCYSYVEYISRSLRGEINTPFELILQAIKTKTSPGIIAMLKLNNQNVKTPRLKEKV